MSAFQRCPNTSELEPLYLPQELYLRPMAKMNISLQLPNVKKLGKSISHWEIMDKLRELVKPDEFTVLKVTKTTVEFIRFEAEVEKKSKLDRVISKLDNKMVKLKDFAEQMRIKAAQWKSDFPSRREWDAFFQEAKDMDEMIPGQRPDTIHLWNMPSKWFMPYSAQFDDDAMPSERIFYRVFEKFGNIRNVDVPICDPYRMKMKEHISGLKYSCHEKADIFEGYVQFKDYIGFTKAMDFFRDKKLVRQEEDGHIETEIKVDFDKTKHLSDASIRRREIVRERLVKKAKQREETDKQHLEQKKKEEENERKKEENLKTQKDIRRRMREEKRKAKILQKLEITGSDEINEKIAKEEKKLVKVQRKLEAIRIVEELFKRIKDKNHGNTQHYNGEPSHRSAELKRLKNTRELDYLNQKEKLHHAVKSRVVLRTILSEDKPKIAKYSDSTDSEDSMFDEEPRDSRIKRPLSDGRHPAELMYEHQRQSMFGHQPKPMYENQPPPMYGYPAYPPMYGGFVPHPGMIYPEIDIYAVYRGRGGLPRSGARGGMRGRGRGWFRGRGRGMPAHNTDYPQEVFEEYVPKYNNKRVDRRIEHDDRRRSYSPHHSSRRTRSRSKSRRSRSRSRKRSYSRSRSRSHSRRHRSYSRSRSKSRRRSRSHKRHSRSHSKSRRSSSRSKSRRRSKSRSKIRDRSRGRSRSGSKSKSKTDRRSRSKSREHKSNRKSRSRSKSRAKSVDSAQFMTPRQLLEQKQKSKSKSRSRSKSWSLPREDRQSKRSSWSRSPEGKRNGEQESSSK